MLLLLGGRLLGQQNLLLLLLLLGGRLLGQQNLLLLLLLLGGRLLGQQNLLLLLHHELLLLLLQQVGRLVGGRRRPQDIGPVQHRVVELHDPLGLSQKAGYPVPHDGSGEHGIDAHAHLGVLHERVPQQVPQLLGVGAGRRRGSGVDDVVAQLPHRGAAEG